MFMMQCSFKIKGMSTCYPAVICELLPNNELDVAYTTVKSNLDNLEEDRTYSIFFNKLTLTLISFEDFTL